MDVRGGQRQANNSKSLHALHAASTQLGKNRNIRTMEQERTNANLKMTKIERQMHVDMKVVLHGISDKI